MSYGKLEQIDNLDKKFGAADLYFRVLVSGPMGLETLLMTDVELDIIQHRASRNPEDTEMVPSAWTKFVAWLA